MDTIVEISGGYVPLFKSSKIPTYRFSSAHCMKYIALKLYTSIVIPTKVALVSSFTSSCGLQMMCYPPDISMFFNHIANLVRYL